MFPLKKKRNSKNYFKNPQIILNNNIIIVSNVKDLELTLNNLIIYKRRHQNMTNQDYSQHLHRTHVHLSKTKWCLPYDMDSGQTKLLIMNYEVSNSLCYR